MPINFIDPETDKFLAGKSTQTVALYQSFIKKFAELGEISLHATKTMIAMANGDKRVAWVTQLGRNFIHVVLPLKQPYTDNLCFTKVAQVPGSTQFNHHLRILHPDDINDEVLSFFKLALKQE